MESRLRISYIGGCLNNQKGLPRKSHYYTHLQAKFKALIPNLNMETSLGSYTSINTMQEDAKKVLDSNNPDIVVFFIRPFTIMPLCKPIIKYEDTCGRIKFGIHPSFYKSKLSWDEKLTDNATEREYFPKNRKRIELRDWNLLAGKILRLNVWAENFLIKKLDEIEKLCHEKNTRLLLISPPGNPESFMGDQICKNITTKLNGYYKNKETKFINLSGFSENMFEDDRLHLNEDGHVKISELIYCGIKEIIKDKKAVVE